MTSPLTHTETELFDALISGDYGNFALVRSALDGEPVAAIAAITREEDEYLITPLAILVTDSLMSRLQEPAT